MKFLNLSYNFVLPAVAGFFILIFFISIPIVHAQHQQTSEYYTWDEIDNQIQQLESMLKSNPNDFNLKLELAVKYYQYDQCEKAIILFDQLLEFRSNYPEVTFGKASCLNELGLPEKSLSVLGTIDNKFANDNPILLTKGNAHLLLGEYEKAEEFYQKVLTKNPDSKSAQNNMILLARETNNHILSETYLVKLLGESPSPSDFDPQMGNMPYTLPINDSENYSATVQIQIRNSSNQLIAVVQSEKILYIPHPFMFEIYDHPSLLVEIIENEDGIFEKRKIIEEIEPVVNSYFMDRAQLYNESGYMVFFAYNMAIPIEEGDHAIIEWTITKKID